jgi:FkbM family methyltransferase
MTIKAKARNLIKVAVQMLAPKTAVHHAATNSRHQEPEVELLSVLVDPRRAAIDVGGHLGAYTSPLVTMVAKLIVFEANPRLATVLANAFPTALVRSEAVSDRKGTVDLQIPIHDGAPADGLASLEPQVGHLTKRVRVTTVMLDELEFDDIGFIKIDVEGHELSVLQGGLNLLKSQRPIVLIEAEERHKKGTIAELFSLFERLEYVGVFVFGTDILQTASFSLEMQDPSLVSSNYRRDGVFANNFIFVPQEKWTPEFNASLTALRKKTAPRSAPSSAEAIQRLAAVSNSAAMGVRTVDAKV